MSLITRHDVVIGTAAGVVCLAVGYQLDKYMYCSSNSSGLVAKLKGKSYTSDDPITRYIVNHSLRLHPAQENLIKTTKKLPRYALMSSPEEIQLLCNLVRTIGAKKTIDVGVFTGYSAMSIALALPKDGVVVACDVTSEYPDIGKPYWKEAGVADKIDLRIGPAVETLQAMIDKGEKGTYDFAFIDADKVNYLQYYKLCLELVRKGGVIAIDNVLWRGTVADPNNNETSTRAIRAVNDYIFQDHTVDISMLTVGDGTTLVFKQ